MNLSLENIQRVINNNDPAFLEDLAQKASSLTLQYFGRTISLYTPLYISNYCSSHCTYCGFNKTNAIKRIKLSEKEIDEEMEHIADTGIENILILTGESPVQTPINYLENAITFAKNYFSCIALEIFPLEERDYRRLYQAGADGVTIYQETYDLARYKEVHLDGEKRNYDFRRHAPERIARAGFRQLSMGILLGLSEISKDLFALYSHLQWMENHYPSVEYSLSFPRLQKIKGHDYTSGHIDDTTFIKVICLTRLLFPRIGINLSTRESSFLRDNALGLGVTRVSAGSKTAVGGYGLEDPDVQEPQFDIADNRSVDEIVTLLKSKNFDPILTDWRRITNT